MSRFQGIIADEAGTRSLVFSLNKVTAHPLYDGNLTKTFQKLWEILKADLENIPANPSTAPVQRRSEDMIEEVLNLLRHDYYSAIGENRISKESLTDAIDAYKMLLDATIRHLHIQESKMLYYKTITVMQRLCVEAGYPELSNQDRGPFSPSKNIEDPNANS